MSRKKRARPRGYMTWKPYKVSQERVAQIQQVLATNSSYLPLTARQIFYALVGLYGYEKTERAYGNLCETLQKARRAGLIAFGDIRDDGVSVAGSLVYDGIRDFNDQTARRAKQYMRDRQHGQQYRIELWCEASGMIPSSRGSAGRSRSPSTPAAGSPR